MTVFRKYRTLILILSALFIIALVVIILLSYERKVKRYPLVVSKKELSLPATPRLHNDQSSRDEFKPMDEQINAFLKKWAIKGASVAIAKEGKLIYAKGFGYANEEDKVKMQPYHMLRIASVSKLITATTIMQMVEKGMLSLSDTVFGERGILNDSMYLNIKDERMKLITVKNLLEHSSGWTTRYGDPMFMVRTISREMKKPLPLCLDDIICFVLNKNMHYNVGTYSSYVNVGYAILGRIIEKISGESYEEYVRKNLLYPIGIRNMRIGRSYPKDKYPDEVMYYDVWDAKRTPAFDNPNQYVFKPEGGHDIYTLGAAGGWVATSVDILRLILCIDGLPTVPDILSQESINQMVLNDDKYDPLGWRFTNARSWIRTGTLAGTSAVAVRDRNGFCWVFLTNTSSWTGSMFPFKIYYFMRDLIEIEHIKWTMDYDFFQPSRYTQPNNIRRDNLEIEKERNKYILR